MGYIYAAIWFIVGLTLIFSVAKEHKVFYFAGGFFILLGGWWLADTLFPESQFFTGAWGTALRIATLIALVGLSIFFMVERNRNIKREMAEQAMKADSHQEDSEKDSEDPKL